MSLEWWPDWHGQSCVIVASGPSAKTANLEAAKGKAKFIAVNNSWQLCPWADVLYACDASWWKQHNGVPEFHGLKVSQHMRAAKMYRDVKPVLCIRTHDRGDEIYLERGKIGWGRNGGFQALNLAVQFGTKHIVLVGFDMRLDLGVHWHGPHPIKKPNGKTVQPTGLYNPHAAQVERWRKAMDGAKGTLDRLGVKVINAAQISALRAYPKVRLEECFAGNEN